MTIGSRALPLIIGNPSSATTRHLTARPVSGASPTGVETFLRAAALNRLGWQRRRTRPLELSRQFLQLNFKLTHYPSPRLFVIFNRATRQAVHFLHAPIHSFPPPVNRRPSEIRRASCVTQPLAVATFFVVPHLADDFFQFVAMTACRRASQTFSPTLTSSDFSESNSS